jgi:hypothetical protein
MRTHTCAHTHAHTHIHTHNTAHRPLPTRAHTTYTYTHASKLHTCFATSTSTPRISCATSRLGATSHSSHCVANSRLSQLWNCQRFAPYEQCQCTLGHLGTHMPLLLQASELSIIATLLHSAPYAAPWRLSCVRRKSPVQAV